MTPAPDTAPEISATAAYLALHDQVKGAREALRRDVIAVEHELRSVKAQMPTFWTVTWGVFFGFLIYSVIGIILTALIWYYGLDFYLRRRYPQLFATPPAAAPAPTASGPTTIFGALPYNPNAAQPAAAPMPRKPDGSIDWERLQRETPAQPESRP